MKKHILYIILFALAVSIQAQTSFYEQVSSMWYNGNPHGVLDIANQRLSINSNDIAGLLLKREFELNFLLLTNAISTTAHILEIGATFTGTNFLEQLPILEADYEMMNIIITNYPPAEYIADLSKTNTFETTMSCDESIQALEADGYFE